MPRRTYKRRAAPRRAHRAAPTYHHRAPATVHIPRGMGPVPGREIAHLKYSDVYSNTVAGAAVAEQIWRLNSIFDPDRTGAGHQPYGYDTLATLYLRYRVFAISWVINVPATNQVLHVALLPVNGATTFTNFTLASENPHAMIKSTPYNGGSTTRFTGRTYLPTLGGDKRTEYKSDDRFQAQFGTNATEVMDLHFVIYNPNITASTLFYDVILIYHVEVYDPLPLAQS